MALHLDAGFCVDNGGRCAVFCLRSVVRELGELGLRGVGGQQGQIFLRYPMPYGYSGADSWHAA